MTQNKNVAYFKFGNTVKQGDNPNPGVLYKSTETIQKIPRVTVGYFSTFNKSKTVYKLQTWGHLLIHWCLKLNVSISS